ncbi:Ig domain-containing protein [Agromyces albus]|uniref:Uncharacterized protein n=1 Tax=Agromyces albus TaxID=205332 RepID=A0A4Q2L3Q2_9MICO|nr:Ig domain-containing protein [Agromyces albus]RXZ72798.1 hypothetical protein ESP51_03095 [Agromyces albus]
MSTFNTLVEIPRPVDGVDPVVYIELKTQEAREIAAANTKAREFIAGLGESDKWARAWRLLLIGAIGVGLVGGGVFLAWQAIESENLAAGIAAAAVVAVLAVALFLNPLQTIERDIVYRRWSDTIVASYYAQFAHDKGRLSDLRLAGRKASEQFALLAVTHEKVAAGSAAAISAIMQAVAAAGADAEDEPDDKAEPTTVTVTPPEDQMSTLDELIDAFKIEAAGPDDLIYESSGHPAGIDIKATTGEYSGKPTTVSAAPSKVTVTVRSAKLGKASTVEFMWTVNA